MYFKFDSTTSPWEDEETRQFYECIPDLKALVPGILYKDSEKVVGITQSIDQSNQIEDLKESDIEKIEKEVEQAAKETDEAVEKINDEDAASKNKNSYEQVPKYVRRSCMVSILLITV